MKKIKENYWAILLGMFFLLFLKQCGISRDQEKIVKELKTITLKMDSLSTKKDIEIQGLKTSKRILYDWNSVVRTAVRPDDRMNEYDREIEKIQKSK